jgi:hypothetical protein
VAVGQKELIERDYLQIHQLLFNPKPITGPDAGRIEDAVAAVKRWFHGQLALEIIGCNEGLGLMVGSEEEVLVNDAASAIDRLIRLTGKIDTKLSGVPVV